MALPLSAAIGASGAGSLGVLFVRLTADSASLTRGMADAEKSVARGSLAIIASITAIAAASIREFAKFDKAMTEAFAIMGDVSEDLKKQLTDTARTLARDSVKSAEEMGHALYFMASAGMSAQQSMKALPAMTQFATAGNFKMARATDLLVDAQAALGLRVKDVNENYENMVRLSDVISKANIQSAATVEQLSEALTNKAAAAMRAVNKDVEEGMAVLGVFAIQGLKGSAAGEQLAIVLRDLQRAAIEQKSVFKELGVEVFDSAGNMKNMADIVGDLEKALRGASTEEQRMALMMMGFQDRTLSGILRLLGFSEQIRTFEKELRNAAGTTEQISEVQLTSFSAEMTILQNRIKDAAISIGEGMRPALSGLSDDLKKSTALNSAANESWKQTGEIFGTILTGSIKGAIMVWEGWRNLLNLVGQAILKVAQIQLTIWLPTFEILSKAFEGFVNLVLVGVNLLIFKLNAWIELLPEAARKATGIAPLKFLEADFKFPISKEEIQDWITILHLAQEELDQKLVAAVVGAAEAVAPPAEEIKKEFKSMTSVIVGELQTVEDDVNRLKRFMADTKVMEGLKEIGMPDRRFVGSDPFVGQALENQRELEIAEQRLAALDALGKQEVALSESVQKKKAEHIEAYNKRSEALLRAQAQITYAAFSSAFNDLAEVTKGFAGEQSAIYKAMFAASKAFAIAEATVKIAQGIAGAASLPWPSNLAAMASVIAATASIVSSIQSVTLAIDGKKAAGGPVRGGSNYLVGERGPEIFSPSANGSIIPNHRIGGDVKVEINNYTDGTVSVNEREEDGQKVIEVMIKKLKGEMASEIRNGTGELSRAMEGSYGLRRGRS